MGRTPGSSQFCMRKVTEEMHVNCNHFCHQLFVSLWSGILMTLKKNKKNMQVHKRMYGLLGPTPIYFELILMCVIVVKLASRRKNSAIDKS